MSMFKGIICAAAIAALGMVGAGCEDDDPFVASGFDAIDTSGDGLVSVTEWDAEFGVWDVNDDGFISQSEYLLNDGFTTLDVDANGLLSTAEWDAAFTDWDLNGDYYLSPSELFY